MSDFPLAVMGGEEGRPGLELGGLRTEEEVEAALLALDREDEMVAARLGGVLDSQVRGSPLRGGYF